MMKEGIIAVCCSVAASGGSCRSTTQASPEDPALKCAIIARSVPTKPAAFEVPATCHSYHYSLTSDSQDSQDYREKRAKRQIDFTPYTIG